MNKIKPTNPHPKDYKIRPWRLTLVITVILFLFVGIPFLIKDHEAWNRFHTLQKEVATIEEKSLTPAGAIPLGTLYKDYKPHKTGEGVLWNIGCIDVECPEISETWVVALEINKETIFLRDTIVSNGYYPDSEKSCMPDSQFCSVFAKKGELDLSISLTDPNEKTTELLKSFNLPDEKNWKVINIYSSYQ